MVIALIIISSIYLIFIGSLILGFNRVQSFEQKSERFVTKFSVIVPFRNESKNLPELVKSIDQLNYPKNLFEIIFVDDDSKDGSSTIIKNYLSKTRNDFNIIEAKRKTNSPKKDALTMAINLSKYDWILTTDADCIVPKTWLKTLDAYIQNHHPIMIVGPVTYRLPETLLHGFQLMDFLSLQGATIGGFGLGKPFLSNGANFAYTHQLFNDLKGFSGNTNIASGDDIFLLEKAIHHDKNSVHYIKSNDVLITTNPQSSIYNLIQQRVRWAAKTTSYKNSFGRGVGLIVLLMNFLIIVVLIMSIIGLITVTVFISVFVFKFIIDICLIYKSAKLFNQTSSLSYYLFSSICYPFFSVFIGIYSLFFHFNWKDRRFSK